MPGPHVSHTSPRHAVWGGASHMLPRGPSCDSFAVDSISLLHSGAVASLAWPGDPGTEHSGQRRGSQNVKTV